MSFPTPVSSMILYLTETEGIIFLRTTLNICYTLWLPCYKNNTIITFAVDKIFMCTCKVNLFFYNKILLNTLTLSGLDGEKDVYIITLFSLEKLRLDISINWSWITHKLWSFYCVSLILTGVRQTETYSCYNFLTTSNRREYNS